MTRRKPYPIPENLNPSGTICVPLSLPDEDTYINMFIRHIRQLTNDRLYEHDDARSAIDIRRNWAMTTLKPLLDALENADFCAETPEVDCLAYPNNVGWIEFLPFNPFYDSGVPDGYLTEPFIIHDGGGSLPPGYQAGDIIVPINAVNLDPFDLFTGELPRIKITTSGIGQLELDLLAIPAGGRAIIGVDKQPNFADIIAGIFDPETETVLDLELDNSSFPNQDDIGVQHEINFTVDEPHEVWITFFPVLDLDLIPLKFGGGIRKNGIQLCGLEGEFEVGGITDLHINENCQLQFVENGLVETIDLSCLIAPLQSQIDSNDADISSLQNQVTINANNITSNDADITNLQSQVTQNISDIADNANNITNLQSQVTQNISDIADNANNITNLQSQVTQNISDIADNANNIADHEIRITALENASPGGSGDGAWKVIHQEVLVGDGLFTLPDLTNYEMWHLEYTVGQATGANTVLGLRVNGDNTGANYENNYTANSNNIGVMNTTAVVGDSAWSRVVVRGRQENDGINPVFDTRVFFQSSQLATPTEYLAGITRRNDEVVYSVDVRPVSGNFISGSSVTVLGVLKADSGGGVLIPNHDYEAFINFADGDASAILSNTYGYYDGGQDAWISVDNPLHRLAMTIGSGETFDIVRVEVDIEFTTHVDQLHLYDDIEGELAFDTIIGREVRIINYDMYNVSGFPLVIRLEDVGNVAKIYSIRLYGNGTLPLSLTNYEV